VRKIMLYLPLQPFQQIAMPSHRQPFLNDAEITLKMIGRKREKESHVENIAAQEIVIINQGRP